MRKLVAALACRNEGSRLYGKPLQNLDVKAGTTILHHMIELLKTTPAISKIMLGIAEGVANEAFVEYAKKKQIGYIKGSETNVLQRLIHCCKEGNGTDVFRITTECPFFYYEIIEEAWRHHINHRNDVTTIDTVPEGTHFEIYTLKALEDSHNLGDDIHRSEHCNLYIREHLSDFKVEVLPVPDDIQRPDIRLTVDYPEDLILCREVYAHLKSKAPRIPLSDIILFLDVRPDLKTLVAPHVAKSRTIWKNNK